MQKLFENWRSYLNEGAPSQAAIDVAIDKAREEDPHPYEEDYLVELTKEVAKLAGYITSRAGASARTMATWSEKLISLPWSREFRLKLERNLGGSRGGRVAIRTGGWAIVFASVLEALDDYTAIFNNNETVANYNRQQLIGDYRVLYNFLKSMLIDINK